MPDISLLEPLTIQSHKGPYHVNFGPLLDGLDDGLSPTEHLIVDKRVAELYAARLKPALQGHSVLQIEATEDNKSLEQMPLYALHLLEHGVRRNHTLVAVGGGIIQDIVCFLSATLLRGVSWRFYPTTLLAQADSCIGSKSSINVGGYKNQIGTFTPPMRVDIATDFLDTLAESDIRSGAGEIIKVHLIAGWQDFRALAADYPRLLRDRELLIHYIRRALAIKKVKIEADEFDQGERLVMNYGHTFGHAIESATHYAVPHGIAVSIGMDFANYVAWQVGLLSEDSYQEMHGVISQNYAGFEKAPVPEETFFNALAKDKKNVGREVTFILPQAAGQICPHRLALDERLREICRTFLTHLKKVN